jgi:anti-anti-sigma factor
VAELTRSTRTAGPPHLFPGAPDTYRERVRAHGLLSRPADVGPADHACWVYDDDAAFAEAARQYLAEGLRHGDRLLCVGDEAVLDAVRRRLGPEPEVADQISRGALEFLPASGAYVASGRLHPAAQLAFYETATRRAIAEGYRGLRVVAELTPVAAGLAGCGDLLRWEHLADDFMAGGSGMSAMCGYRRGLLAPNIVADVAAVHPLACAGPDEAPFSVFFDDGRLAVAGTLDAFCADRLNRVLAASHVAGPVVRMDLRRVEFIDAAGCRAIAAWAQQQERTGVQVHLVGASRLVRRMWRLLGFTSLTGTSFEDDPS